MWRWQRRTPLEGTIRPSQLSPGELRQLAVSLEAQALSVGVQDARLLSRPRAPRCGWHRLQGISARLSVQESSGRISRALCGRTASLGQPPPPADTGPPTSRSMAEPDEDRAAAVALRSRLEDYKILKTLGSGSWGTVLLASRRQDAGLCEFLLPLDPGPALFWRAFHPTPPLPPHLSVDALKRISLQHRSQRDQLAVVQEAQVSWQRGGRREASV